MMEIWLAWAICGIATYGILKDQYRHSLARLIHDETGHLMKYCLLEDLGLFSGSIFCGFLFFPMIIGFILSAKLSRIIRGDYRSLNISFCYHIPDYLCQPGTGFPIQITNK
jgi:hypothetical protein